LRGHFEAVELKEREEKERKGRQRKGMEGTGENVS